MSEYLNKLFSSATTTLDILIWSLFVGIIIAGVVMIYQKRIMGACVRALLGAEAVGAEKAQRLGGLDYKPGYFVRRALSTPSSSLRRILRVKRENGEDVSEKRLSDPLKFLFYIPKEKAFDAGERYRAKNTNAVVLIILIITFFVVSLLLLKYIPELVSLAERTFAAGQDIT